MNNEEIRNLAKKIYVQIGIYKMHTGMAKYEIKTIEEILKTKLKRRKE